MTSKILNAACGLIGCGLAAQAGAAGCETNLLTNPGFEQGQTGWSLPPAKVVSGGRSGRASLYYSNPDPAEYHQMLQTLQVKAGQTIAFGVWVRGDNLRGKGDQPGAGVYVESYDAKGRHLAGNYPQGLLGSSGWQPVEGSFTVPAEATTTVLGLYMRKGTTGNAWFDDAYVCSQPTAPALYQMRAGGQSASSLIEVQQPQEVQVESTLLDSQRTAVRQESRRYHVAERQRVEFSLPANLAAGEYRLQQQVTDVASKHSRSSEMPVSIGEAPPKVALDEQGYTLRQGKRFFPLGIYMYGNMATDEHLARIRDAGFNTLLNYNYGAGRDPYAYFRKTQQYGLQVIFSLKDFYPGLDSAPKTRLSYPQLTASYVEKFKTQPNLLAWYINDELAPKYAPQIEQMHLQVKQQDPDHLTFQALNQTGALNAYFNSSDVLASDPYPVGRDADMTRTLEYSRLTVQVARQAKGAWLVMQIMDHAAYEPHRKPRQPSEAEIRNQAWLGLIGGVKGLLFYSYTDLFYKRRSGDFNQQEFDGIWQGVARVAQQIDSFTPYLLSGESATLSGNNTAVPARLFIDGERGLVLIANPYYRPMAARFDLPPGWRWQGQPQIDAKLPAVGSSALWVQRDTSNQ
ncbi:carbohydrate-binding protein CenC [Serratia ureilytica]|uniref:carbohydrate-binding protein CenC n=1 Tax=Serratia ureilytica TaxID=300181 RepID=UPI0018D9ECFC|nr:carbohydrate-binding protein CenC [Serratia ureilytica]MBH3122780.1 carbohydrate-binding protein CenC [Serratia ureilytica]